MSDTIKTSRATAEADKPLQTQAPAKRKLLLSLLAATVVLAGAGYGAYYYTSGRYYQSTDDAYVSGNLVQLTPQVSGTVVGVDRDHCEIGRAHV